MGYTRARRYANYKGWKKYDKEKDYQMLERGTDEEQKTESAAIFYKKWKAAGGKPDICPQKKHGKSSSSNPSEGNNEKTIP